MESKKGRGISKPIPKYQLPRKPIFKLESETMGTSLEESSRQEIKMDEKWRKRRDELAARAEQRRR